MHLQEIGGGKTYSQLSAEAMALPKGSPAYTAAEAKVQTVFQGTTLRGLLLEAYGFSLIADIAFWCAIAAFALAGVMAVLVVPRLRPRPPGRTRTRSCFRATLPPAVVIGA